MIKYEELYKLLKQKVFRVNVNDWATISSISPALSSDSIRFGFSYEKNKELYYWREEYTLHYLEQIGTIEKFTREIIFKDHWVLDKNLYRLAMGI